MGINPSIETLNKLCEIYDTTLADLFNFSDPKDKLSIEREAIAVRISEVLNKASKAKLKKLKIFIEEIL